METSCKNLIQENQEVVRDMIIEDDVTMISVISNLNMLEMPDSIFLHIFTYLPFSAIGAVSQVCTRWNQISYDELLWRSVFLRHFKLPSNTMMPKHAKSWRLEFKRLYYHTPAVLSEERKEHKDEVLHVSFSHDGTKFATCSKDGFFKVWQCTEPVQLLFKMDMKTSFSWKFTQFSQFNETDTCLLVSGVYFGRLSTSGEIAVFNLQDGFKMQCRVTNKPYDVFGAWYDNDHLLSGTLYWTGDFNSVSAVWLSKASQEVESEIESVSMVLYRFENVNSSSIRLLHVAEIDKEEQTSDYVMDRDSNYSANSSIQSSSLGQEPPSKQVKNKVKKNQSESQRNCLLDKLLSKVIAEDEFDIENEDETDEDELNENRISDQGFETCESSDSELYEASGVEISDIEINDCAVVSEIPIESEPAALSFTSFQDERSQGIKTSESGASFSSCHNLMFGHRKSVPEATSSYVDEVNRIRGSSEVSDIRCYVPLSALESSVPEDNDLSASWFHIHSPSDNGNNSNSGLDNVSHCAASCLENFSQRSTIPAPQPHKDGVGQNIGSMLARAGSCDMWDSENGAKSEVGHRKTKNLHFTRSHSFDDHLASFSEACGGSSASLDATFSHKAQQLNASSVWRDYFPIAVPRLESTQEPPALTGAINLLDGKKSSINLDPISLPTTDQRAKPLCTKSIATQTEGIPSRTSSFHSLSHTSRSSSLSPDLSNSAPREKLLIYTWGSETYIPHKIGIKRMRWSDFSKGEVTARRSSMLLPDVMENLHNMAGNRRDKPDVTIEMHGHIVGLSLSPDHKFLYVNCRPWPKNYIISDPQESPPLAQEVEISTIDLTTFNFVGPVLRSHKAYTHSDECFFLNLDVSEHYVASGAEDRQGYLWDRHYGMPLYRFPHRNVVNCVAINPQDPELLVTVSDDYTFKVWISRCKSKERARKLISLKDSNISVSSPGI
ncbi:hypothetical protein Btru_057988 [Bulinus truncatus]|nr:hypothetical protein Btru_057988 [Bulinus truncatus]